MKHNNYKYRLHYLLRQLSVNDYEIAMKWLPEKFGISQITWKRWIYLKESQFSDIPATVFFQLATFFDVHPKELFTEPTEDIATSFINYKEDLKTN